MCSRCVSSVLRVGTTDPRGLILFALVRMTLTMTCSLRKKRQIASINFCGKRSWHATQHRRSTLAPTARSKIPSLALRWISPRLAGPVTQCKSRRAVLSTCTLHRWTLLPYFFFVLHHPLGYMPHADVCLRPRIVSHRKVSGGNEMHLGTTWLRVPDRPTTCALT
jgi:hypothetical protein